MNCSPCVKCLNCSFLFSCYVPRHFMSFGYFPASCWISLPLSMNCGLPSCYWIFWTIWFLSFIQCLVFLYFPCTNYDTFVSYVQVKHCCIHLVVFTSTVLPLFWERKISVHDIWCCEKHFPNILFCSIFVRHKYLRS